MVPSTQGTSQVPQGSRVHNHLSAAQPSLGIGGNPPTAPQPPGCPSPAHLHAALVDHQLLQAGRHPLQQARQAFLPNAALLRMPRAGLVVRQQCLWDHRTRCLAIQASCV